MNVSVSTHDHLKYETVIKMSTQTDWNPWISIRLTAEGSIDPNEMSIHLSGLSIEEADEFTNGWFEAGWKLRDWNKRRKMEQATKQGA